jgi:hypothetical protein
VDFVDYGSRSGVLYIKDIVMESWDYEQGFTEKDSWNDTLFMVQ